MIQARLDGVYLYFYVARSVHHPLRSRHGHNAMEKHRINLASLVIMVGCCAVFFNGNDTFPCNQSTVYFLISLTPSVGIIGDCGKLVANNAQSYPQILWIMHTSKNINALGAE
ncbi:hypothetical protein [Sulfurivirga caldicuralii]|uniref:hypothetical protein n=1 Tax=Sulfurivirga caldicuralii TaxID=364032 RepID=UPI0011802830|nr:hypothetical protein [Sulfurivirga caldicuralii]